MASISALEHSYIVTGIEKNLRSDGRSRLDYRNIQLETGLLSQTSGSCRLQMHDPQHGFLGGMTDILVGVKVEIGEIADIDAVGVEDGEEGGEGVGGGAVDQPEIGLPIEAGNRNENGEMVGNGNERKKIQKDGGKNNKGRIVCSVECTPTSTTTTSQSIQELEDEYTAILNRLLNGPQGGVDLSQLVIIPNSQCWVIYVDVLILSHGGHPLDGILLAIHAALSNTRIPKTNIVDLGDGELEFELSDDLDAATPVPGWELVPVGITLCKIGGSSNKFIVDPNLVETVVSDFKLLLAVNKDGKICGMVKTGSGSVNAKLMTDMITAGKTLGMGMVKKLHAYLKEEEKWSDNEKIGFFASVF